MNREFTAEEPNEKWITDVTEFKYDSSKKAYLSAILDLYDGSIVSYVLGHSNNNKLVFNTLDQATNLLDEEHPLIHSDCGFQYTSHGFKRRIDEAEMTHSMSRVGNVLIMGRSNHSGEHSNVRSIIYISIRHLRTSRKQLMNTFTSTITIDIKKD